LRHTLRSGASIIANRLVRVLPDGVLQDEPRQRLIDLRQSICWKRLLAQLSYCLHADVRSPSLSPIFSFICDPKHRFGRFINYEQKGGASVGLPVVSSPRTTTRRFPTPWRPDKMLGGYVVCDATRRSGDGGFLPLCRFAARRRRGPSGASRALHRGGGPA
jgi:hypothetical protein